MLPEKAQTGTLVFTNVRDIFLRRGQKIREVLSTTEAKAYGAVVVTNGTIICAGTSRFCSLNQFPRIKPIDLEGGSISWVKSLLMQLSLM